MITPQVISVKNYIILHDTAWLVTVPDKWFTAEYWQEQNAVIGQASGRGTSWFVRRGDEELVLRHYKRGGMVARISEDRYIWLGLKLSRPWREWHLLMEMYEEGLPVPKPCAARIFRHGPFYSADILMHRIPDTQSLTHCLQLGDLSEAVWSRIGETIAHFHNACIYHADLNANNILLNSKQEVYLIDFDQGRRREPGEWQQDNLERLERSLNKEQEKTNGQLHFNDASWRSLMVAYEKIIK